MSIDEKTVYTPQEVQRILKISHSTFTRLVKKGGLRATKVGGQYRILGKDLLGIFANVMEEEKA